jgi:hypothetical protein
VLLQVQKFVLEKGETLVLLRTFDAGVIDHPYTYGSQ